jgi:hypothetical protein
MTQVQNIEWKYGDKFDIQCRIRIVIEYFYFWKKWTNHLARMELFFNTQIKSKLFEI